MNKHTATQGNRRSPRLWALALVAGSALILSGCDSRKTVQSISAQRTDNAQVNVELVLTNDGIKVYRFWDGWKYVYYTDARGRTEWEERVPSGKTVIITPHSVETVK